MTLEEFKNKYPFVQTPQQRGSITVGACRISWRETSNCKFLMANQPSGELLEALFKKMPYYPGLFCTAGTRVNRKTYPPEYRILYEVEVPVSYDSACNQIHYYIQNPYHTHYKDRLDKMVPVLIGDKTKKTIFNYKEFLEVEKKYKSNYYKYRALVKLMKFEDPKKSIEK